MRLTEFMVVIIAALLFLVPMMNKEKNGHEIQAEEAPTEDFLEEPENTSLYRITYRVTNPRQEKIADIIWMKKAAEVARNEGIPYFNILEQNTTKEFVRSADRQLPVIEGVIELDPDPMRAEFDAEEIEDLSLTEIP